MAYGAQLNVAIDTQAALAILGDVADGLTSTGASQSTALLITSAVNVVRTTAAGTGVRLPGPLDNLPAGIGDRITIANFGTNSLNVYPPSGGTIQGGAINAAIILVALGALSFTSINGSDYIAECCDGVTFVSGGSVEIVVPPVAVPPNQLKLTGQQPQVMINNLTRVFFPPEGNLILTGRAPNILNPANHLRTPPTAALLLSGNAPNYAQDTLKTPPAGAVLLTGQAPTASAAMAVTWDSVSNNGMTLSNGDLDAEESGSALVGVRSNGGRTTGLYYWEYEILAAADAADMYPGITVAVTPFTNLKFGTGTYPLAWRGRTGQVFVEGAQVAISIWQNVGDIIRIAADIANKNVWCAFNNNAWVGGGDPATLTTPTGTWTQSGAIYPVYLSDNITSGLCKMRLLPSAASFQKAIPTGFSPYSPI